MGGCLCRAGVILLAWSWVAEELQIRKGKTLQTQFPKLVRDEWNFYGNRDSLGNMNKRRAIYLEDEDQG